MAAPTVSGLQTVTQDILIPQGSVIQKLLTVIQWEQDPDSGKIKRDRADLTGATIWASVVKISDGSEVIAKKSDVVAQIEILSPQTGNTKGQARIKFAAVDTETLDTGTGKYKYEVWVQLADGTRDRVIDVSAFTVDKREMPAFA